MTINQTQPGKKFNYKSIILLALIFIVLGAVILLQGKDTFFDRPEQPFIKAGFLAPDFTLPGLDGKMVSLSSFRGKVVVLNIWATWCPPCVQEMPSMERLYQELKGEDFEILAVSVDRAGAGAVAPFMQKYKLNFPILLNPEGTIQRLYGTTGIPESFIINRQGIVEKKIIGAIDWAAPEAIRFFRSLSRKPGEN